MSVLHSIIAGNLIMIAFNMVGMASNMEPPPIWAYALMWVAIVFGIYVLSNP